MQTSIETMASAIAERLEGRLYGFWLCGSVVLGDFRPGWSDIDFLALAEDPISEAQAEALLDLRQRLSAQFPGDPYFRCFEGVIAGLEEYQTGQLTRLVYWGSSGQRVTARWRPDAFTRLELARYGRCVRGSDDRRLFPPPDRGELLTAVRAHYEGIRSCAVQTDESLYACGWLLDLARCVYTLRYWDVIGKTRAGLWALEEGLFPEEEALRRTLEIRQSPAAFRDREDVKRWLRSLGPTVQRCADVLERELRRAEAAADREAFSGA